MKSELGEKLIEEKDIARLAYKLVLIEHIPISPDSFNSFA